MKFIHLLATATAVSLAATPALAQEAEEARTTYSVTMLKLADGADERWLEIRDEYVTPAQEAAGMTPDVVHWVMMNPDYDLIVVSEMPEGLASFDSHANPTREAMFAAMAQMLGGEQQLEALGEEWDTLVESQTTLYTHTHP